MEAVLLGKDLEVRLFKIHIFKDSVGPLGVDCLPEIFAEGSYAGIILCCAQVDCQADLLDEEPDDCHIKVKQLFRLTVEDCKEFVLVVFEISRGSVRRDDGSLVLEQPWL